MINIVGSFLKEFLSWRAILDVALATAALYFINRTLRRLGTWKVLLGIFMAMNATISSRFTMSEGSSSIFSISRFAFFEGEIE
ncbi:hypothetical protein KJ966_28670 [bacterium]|nr:hypothetical protein [bacterium]